jgi:hypothetical protein
VRYLEVEHGEQATVLEHELIRHDSTTGDGLRPLERLVRPALDLARSGSHPHGTFREA